MTILKTALITFAAMTHLAPQVYAEMVPPERAGYYDTAWPSEHIDLW